MTRPKDIQMHVDAGLPSERLISYPGLNYPVFVGVAGVIGVGKTQLTGDLARAIDADPHFEPVKENEYLSDFYVDKARYAFAMQVYLLNKRFAQHQQVVWTMSAAGRSAVQDRTIYEDSIFAEMLCEAGLMEARDFRTYVELFGRMSNFLQRPDLIIYLTVPPSVALQRVRTRGRAAEQAGVTLAYLHDLANHYEQWFERMRTRLNIIQVPWEDFQEPELMRDLIERETRDHRVDAARWGRKF